MVFGINSRTYRQLQQREPAILFPCHVCRLGSLPVVATVGTSAQVQSNVGIASRTSAGTA